MDHFDKEEYSQHVSVSSLMLTLFSYNLFYFKTDKGLPLQRYREKHLGTKVTLSKVLCVTMATAPSSLGCGPTCLSQSIQLHVSSSVLLLCLSTPKRTESNEL